MHTRQGFKGSGNSLFNITPSFTRIQLCLTHFKNLKKGFEKIFGKILKNKFENFLCQYKNLIKALKVRRETQSTELTQDEGLGINITWRVGSFATWFGPLRIPHGPITWLTKICLARIAIGGIS